MAQVGSKLNVYKEISFSNIFIFYLYRPDIIYINKTKLCQLHNLKLNNGRTDFDYL